MNNQSKCLLVIGVVIVIFLLWLSCSCLNSQDDENETYTITTSSGIETRRGKKEKLSQEDKNNMLETSFNIEMPKIFPNYMSTISPSQPEADFVCPNTKALQNIVNSLNHKTPFILSYKPKIQFLDDENKKLKVYNDVMKKVKSINKCVANCEKSRLETGTPSGLLEDMGVVYPVTRLPCSSTCPTLAPQTYNMEIIKKLSNTYECRDKILSKLLKKIKKINKKY